jgi:hypothetical protein
LPTRRDGISSWRTQLAYRAGDVSQLARFSTVVSDYASPPESRFELTRGKCIAAGGSHDA